MDKICQQINIPTVDNTLSKCGDDFKSTDCIVMESAIAYLGLQPNATLTEVLSAMLNSLIDARTRIVNLEVNGQNSNQGAPTINAFNEMITIS